MPYREDHKITVLLGKINYRKNTRNGNPVADFVTDGGTFRSSSDSAFMYGVENDHPVGKTVELTLTKAGRVKELRVLESQK